jgi:hypothetical protein
MEEALLRKGGPIFLHNSWQELDLSPGKFYLYSSYLDNRRRNTNGPSIRILGLRNSSLQPQINLYCRIWFDEETKPAVSRVIEQASFSKHYFEPGKLQPYLLTCKLPETYLQKVPISDSIVKWIRTRARNHLKVIHNGVEKKKEFAVCVKCFYGITDDFLVRLVEWIELVSLLGADKIFFYYELGKFDNLKFQKLVHHYVEEGLVDLSYYSAPNASNELSGKIKWNKPRQMITWNDCLYRNLYRYKYLAVLDTDEVIVPKIGTWRDLLKVIDKKSITASFRFQNVYFMDDMLDSHLKSRNTNSEDILLHRNLQQLPNYMHILRHVIRSNKFDTNHMKSIHKTDRVVLVHSHYAIKCFESKSFIEGKRSCNSKFVGPHIAQLQHYRKSCQGKKDCAEMKRLTVKDSIIWRYKTQLVDRVSKSLVALGFMDPKKVLCCNTCHPLLFKQILHVMQILHYLINRILYPLGDESNRTTYGEIKRR